MSVITETKHDPRDEQIEELIRQNAALTKSVGELAAVSKAHAGKLQALASPDPRQFIHDIQADRLLGSPGPTTWSKLIGETGHVRQLARQLLSNERSFRAAVAVWYRNLGKSIVAAIRAGRPLASAVTDQHRERLRKIVEEHVRQSALLSAAIEFQMHQNHPSAKACISYVQKGVSIFVKSLPQRVITAVKLAVAAIMAVFIPDAVIDPIIDKMERRMRDLADVADPFEQPGPRTIAEPVRTEVLGRERIEAVAAGVAVTANATAANAGTAAAGNVLAEQGIVNARKWATLHGSGKVDAKVRPTHRAANGQTVKIGEPFLLQMQGGGTETCSGPGDMKLSAGNLRNCRCLAISLWVDKK